MQVTSPEVVDVPDGPCRSDGSSVYDRPGRGRWALTHTIDTEAWLLKAAAERGAPRFDADTLRSAVISHGLGQDQCRAVVALLGDGRRVCQLVGPAGAGKTRTPRAAVDAWQAGGGEVLGLAVSQTAANVLAVEADVRSVNTAKWLHETTAGGWSMQEGSLVLVDETSMVATDQLVAIVDQARRRNGSVDVHRHRDHATVTLLADYLASHTHLGYATTAHRAQGMTVDISHALTAATDTHEQLYVAATHGRDANHIWVATDTHRDLIRNDQDLPTAEQVLSGIVRRRDPSRHAAHQSIADSQHAIGTLGRLGAIYEDACRRATRQWVTDTLVRHGIDVTDDPRWPALLAKLRQLALAGHDQHALLTRAIQPPLGDVQSVAGVLQWRLTDATSAAGPVRPRGLTAAIPPIDNHDTALARQVVALMRHRWHQLRVQLTRGPTPAWARDLGPRPTGGDILDSWLTAATSAAAYRDRYELADHTDLIGPRPAPSRPDARAAYDLAQRQIDLHMARILHLCDGNQLDRLEADHKRILDGMPTFDPDQLNQAHRLRDDLYRQMRTATHPEQEADIHRRLDDAQRDVARLEHAAREHTQWRKAAAQSTNTLRQIRLVRQLRASRPPVRGARRR